MDTFTKDEIHQIMAGVNEVWTYIGYDIMQIDGVGTSIPVAEWAELCLDADRLETQNTVDKDLLKRFRAMDWNGQSGMVISAAPYQHYGV